MPHQLEIQLAELEAVESDTRATQCTAVWSCGSGAAGVVSVLLRQRCVSGRKRALVVCRTGVGTRGVRVVEPVGAVVSFAACGPCGAS